MISLKGSTIAHTSGGGANNISSAPAVRVRCGTTAGTVTIAGTNSPYAGAIKIAASEVITLVKQPADTIAVDQDMDCTPVGHHY